MTEWCIFFHRHFTVCILNGVYCQFRLRFHLALLWPCPLQLFSAFGLPTCMTHLDEWAMQVLCNPPKLLIKTSFTAQSLRLPEAVFVFPRSIPRQSVACPGHVDFSFLPRSGAWNFFMMGIMCESTRLISSWMALLEDGWNHWIWPIISFLISDAPALKNQTMVSFLFCSLTPIWHQTLFEDIEKLYHVVFSNNFNSVEILDNNLAKVTEFALVEH